MLAQAPRQPGQPGQPDQGPGEDAAAGLLQTLAGLQQHRRSKTDRRLARHLGAAALHYAGTGNLDNTLGTTVSLPDGGRRVNLGRWLYHLRTGHTQPWWARPILEALGMTDLPATQAQTRDQAQPQAQPRPLTPAQAQAQAQALALAQAPREPRQGPGEDAAAGLLQTLAGLESSTGPTTRDGILARHLGAAVRHYARTGTVNATRRKAVTLPDGDQVNLGDWLNNLRHRPAQLRWARPILEALGMRGGPATQAQAQAQADAEVLAQALAQAPRQPGQPGQPDQGPGEDAAAGLLQTLAGLESTGPTTRDGILARNLGAAVRHYARTGNLDTTRATTVRLPDGDQVNLGEWLITLRHRRAQPWWARPVLEALGMTGLPATQAQAQTQAEALALAQAQAQALAQAPRPSGPPDQPDRGPGEDAAAGLLQTLAGLESSTGPTTKDGRLARHLGAAALHYARTGTLDDTTRAIGVSMPDGGQVNLGDWLYRLRTGTTQPRWAGPILEALGMTDLPATQAPAQALGPALGMTGLPPVGAADPTAAGPAAGPASGPAAGPASQPGEARPRPVPVFGRVEVVIDQARREEVGQVEGEAELGDAELMITGWRLETQHQLAYRAESDQEFPWRDPSDPLHRVYAPYADAEGGLHPAVTALDARIGPVQRGLQRMAYDPRDPRLSIAPQDWPTVPPFLELEVADSGSGHHRGAARGAADPAADPDRRRRPGP